MGKLVQVRDQQRVVKARQVSAQPHDELSVDLSGHALASLQYVGNQAVVALRELHVGIEYADLVARDRHLTHEAGYSHIKIDNGWTVGPAAYFPLLDLLPAEDHRGVEYTP